MHNHKRRDVDLGPHDRIGLNLILFEHTKLIPKVSPSYNNRTPQLES